MSQETLGQLLGLTFQQVQKYEKGVNRIGAGRLFEIANALGVGILYFYDGIIDELSVRAHGFAEDEAPAPELDSVPSSERIELNLAFMKIHDPKARRRALDFVRSLAEEAVRPQTRPN